MEDTSGQGRHAVVPEEAKRWNWGAFLLTWIWGIGNKVWLALIVLISLLAGFIMVIVGPNIYGWRRISYEVWLALFFVMLFIGFIVAIVLGIKGSKWAWQNKRWDSIEHFRRTQRRWAKWGIVLSVVWLGYLALIIPNFFPYAPPRRHDQREMAFTESRDVQYAVTAMMTDSNVITLPNPIVTATNDMGAFPDATSVAGSADKLKDWEGNRYGSGDKNGYVLYGHDRTANNDNTTLVNYIATRYTKGTYTVNAEGIVTQVTTGFE